MGVVLALLRCQLDTRVRTVKDLPRTPRRTALGQIPHDRDLAKDTAPSRPIPTRPPPRRTAGCAPTCSSSTPPGHFGRSRSRRRSRARASRPRRSTWPSSWRRRAPRSCWSTPTCAHRRSPTCAGWKEPPDFPRVLIHEAALDDVVQPWQVDGLDVLAAGQIPRTRASSRVRRDGGAAAPGAAQPTTSSSWTPRPLLAVTDGALLARRTDGALVDRSLTQDPPPGPRRGPAKPGRIGAQVLGVLVNGRTTPVPSSVRLRRTPTDAASPGPFAGRSRTPRPHDGGAPPRGGTPEPTPKSRRPAPRSETAAGGSRRRTPGWPPRSTSQPRTARTDPSEPIHPSVEDAAGARADTRRRPGGGMERP